MLFYLHSKGASVATRLLSTQSPVNPGLTPSFPIVTTFPSAVVTLAIPSRRLLESRIVRYFRMLYQRYLTRDVRGAFLSASCAVQGTRC
jgi:hypothetical protein